MTKYPVIKYPAQPYYLQDAAKVVQAQNLELLFMALYICSVSFADFIYNNSIQCFVISSQLILPCSQKIFRGHPNISLGQLNLVQPKYNPT